MSFSCRVYSMAEVVTFSIAQRDSVIVKTAKEAVGGGVKCRPLVVDEQRQKND